MLVNISAFYNKYLCKYSTEMEIQQKTGFTLQLNHLDYQFPLKATSSFLWVLFRKKKCCCCLFLIQILFWVPLYSLLCEFTEALGPWPKNLWLKTYIIHLRHVCRMLPSSPYQNWLLRMFCDTISAFHSTTAILDSLESVQKRSFLPHMPHIPFPLLFSQAKFSWYYSCHT